jgi:hypothetical protein
MGSKILGRPSFEKSYDREGLFVEQLERRELLDGKVSVVVEGNNIFVDGDGEANEINVLNAGGLVSIQAGNATTTVVGGNTGLANGAVGSIVIRMRGGDDVVNVSSIAVARSITANTGAGNDEVNLIGVGAQKAITVSLGAGEDRFSIDASNSATLTIAGASGRDIISITSTTTTRDLRITTGAGNQTIEIRNSTIGGSTVIRTHGGNDTVTFGDNRFEGTTLIATGAGADRFVTDSLIENVFLSKTKVLLGSGGDYIESYSIPFFAKPSIVSGGAGIDDFDIPKSIYDDLSATVPNLRGVSFETFL